MLATKLIDAAIEKANSSQIEWTMFNEMTITELCFNFFSVFLVISLIPFFVLIILKSEAKQAEFQVLTKRIEQERVIIGDKDTTCEQNFKLVQVWGKIETELSLKDNLFDLVVNNSLRLSRKVEMYQYCKKSVEQASQDGSESEEQENLSIDEAVELRFSSAPVHAEDTTSTHRNPKFFPFNNCEKIVRKANLHNF